MIQQSQEKILHKKIIYDWDVVILFLYHLSKMLQPTSDKYKYVEVPYFKTGDDLITITVTTTDARLLLLKKAEGLNAVMAMENRVNERRKSFYKEEIKNRTAEFEALIEQVKSKL